MKDVKFSKDNYFLRIGLDFDGVIIYHSQTKIQKAREFGFKIELDQTPSNRLKNSIEQRYYRQIQEYIYGPDGTAQALMINGVDKGLQFFKDSGYEFFLISRRQPKFQSGALDWLGKNLPGVFDQEKILFVQQDIDKDKACQELKIQIYLDDKVTVLEKLKSVPQKFLYDPYHLRDDFKLKDIQPVSSWTEFLSHIKKSVN